MVGKIPGVGTISKVLGNKLSAAIINSGALTEKELEILIRIIKYDTQVSESLAISMKNQVVGKALSEVEKHLLKTAIEETEKQIIKVAGGPTYSGIKKDILKAGLEKGLS
jgi:hypothetical protein